MALSSFYESLGEGYFAADRRYIIIFIFRSSERKKASSFGPKWGISASPSPFFKVFRYWQHGQPCKAAWDQFLASAARGRGWGQTYAVTKRCLPRRGKKSGFSLKICKDPSFNLCMAHEPVIQALFLTSLTSGVGPYGSWAPGQGPESGEPGHFIDTAGPGPNGRPALHG